MARARRKQIPPDVRRARSVKGGLARTEALTSTERSTIARQAARVRWEGERARGPRRLDLPPCGTIRVVDLGDHLRLEIDAGKSWAVWTEAHVEEALALLRRWRLKQRRARRRGGIARRRDVDGNENASIARKESQTP